jgi:hypothetical protein
MTKAAATALEAALEAATNSFYDNDVDADETRKVMVYADTSFGGVAVDVRYEDDAFGGLCIGELGQVDGKTIAACL